HGAPPAIAVAGGPYAGEALVEFDGSGSYDPQGGAIASYEWDFGDGSTGTGVAPSHSYAADGVYTATLVVVDSKGNRSMPSRAQVTIADHAPVVNAGPALQVVPVGLPTSMAVAFSDLGLEDNPWTWTIAWGDGTTDAGSTETQGESFVVNHAYPGVGSYAAILSVTDKDGSTGSDTATITIAPPEEGTVILAAGDIASCGQERDESTARILDSIPGTVFTLGDNVYPDAQHADYVNCFEPTWGRHKGRLFAVLGNHEYTVDPAASFDYFGDRAGPRGLGYYSYNVGDWHIVVINDNLPIGTGSTQDVWLKADLAANPRACTLAMFHQPRFMSADDAYTLRDSRKTLWNRLYAAGAELVLNGHQHFYERFHPMRPDGTRDDATGIQEMIVGVGGESSDAPTVNIWPTSAVRSDHFGVLKLTLLPGRWEWKFIPAKGYSFTDSGSGTCH
ncbi:MAG TPA: PKD domain-containing protein, partial [Gemmatimonadaceae bacterium]|nr:PKD domain-containing protein [Gemmatimonadaceae bacterium]